MRLDSINGKGHGKSGAKVYYVNHGVQIEREYTSSVSNPSTANQVTQRSRFKLQSQVSAALAPVIVIPRKGIQSPRNLFVKRNNGYFYGSPQGAQVSYENLQITAGNMGLPNVICNREGSINMQLILSEPVLGTYDRVIYNVFRKTAEGMLMLAQSTIVEITASTATAGVEVDKIEGDIVVYAYGMRDKNEKARAAYGNYKVETGQDLATLIANRTLEIGNYAFSQTRGISLTAEQDTNTQAGAGEALLYLTTHGDGQIKATIGSGNPVIVTDDVVSVPVGTSVTLEAIEPEPWVVFLGWYYNGQQHPFSLTTPYTFSMNGMKDIVAEFGIRNYTPGLE